MLTGGDLAGARSRHRAERWGDEATRPSPKCWRGQHADLLDAASAAAVGW